MFYYSYLGPKMLSGLDRHKYQCVDTSPLSIYVMVPTWVLLAKALPKWVAPNLLTLMSLVSNLLVFAVSSIWDYNVEGLDLPRLAYWAMGGFLLLGYILDGLDGAQARRTKTGSVLGEIMDHGCDEVAIGLLSASVVFLYGRDLDGWGIPPLRLYTWIFTGMFVSVVGHWESYLTGYFILPFFLDTAIMLNAAVYFALGTYGNGLLKTHLFEIGNFQVSFALIMELASFLLLFHTFVGFVGNIFFKADQHKEEQADRQQTEQADRHKTEQADQQKSAKPTWALSESLRPAVSLVVFTILAWSWVLGSRNQVWKKDLRCFSFLTCILLANIGTRIMMAHICKSSVELINFLLVPFALATGFILSWPEVTLNMELAALYGLTLLVVLTHVHYFTCVVLEVSEHLKVELLRIPAKATQEVKKTK